MNSSESFHGTIQSGGVKEYFLPMGLALAGFAGLSAFVQWQQIDLFVSDAAWYWRDSLAWQAPFNRYHVPAYPLALALARGLTFDLMPPLRLMQATCLGFLLVAVAVLVQLVRRFAGRECIWPAALLFIFFPCTGLFFSVVYPLADIMAVMALFLAAQALFDERPYALCGWFAVAALTHKATWPIIGLLLALLFLRRRRMLPIGACVVLVIPLAAYWIAGAMHYDNYLWLLSTSAQDAASKTALPMFDGVIGTLMAGGVVKLGKMSIVLGVMALAVACLITARRAEDLRLKLMAFGFSGGILFLSAAVNQHLIWSVVRFGRILVLPFGLLLAFRLVRIPQPALRAGLAVVAIGLFISQIVFARWFDEKSDDAKPAASNSDLGISEAPSSPMHATQFLP